MFEPSIVLQKAYDWNLWILPKVETFRKGYRFSLGKNLVDGSLSLLMNLVDATYRSRNASSLGAAAADVNRIRYMIRMAKDLRELSLDGYEFASKALDEIGRMTGGWWKSAQANRETSR